MLQQLPERIELIVPALRGRWPVTGRRERSMVGARGIEPAVDRLKAGCSALSYTPAGARPRTRTGKLSGLSRVTLPICPAAQVIPPGIEPGSAPSESAALIHWATGPWRPSR
jgi:hypothetical protein